MPDVVNKNNAAEIRAGVIGWPIEHSRSPLIHQFWLRTYGITQGRYEAIAIKPDDIESALNDMRAQDYAGVNVTVPHKIAVFDYVQKYGKLDKAAHHLGAVNTLVFTHDNVIGYNTDGVGFIAGLQSQTPTWQVGPVVIIGAGGAARAVIGALADSGVSFFSVVNRTLSKGQAIMDDLGVAGDVLSFGDKERLSSCLTNASLLVNTSTLGMTGAPPLEFDIAMLPREAVVCDVVYTPLETPLLQAAAARGLRVVDGLGMLLHQAVPGFEAWFGVHPEVTEELRRHIIDRLSL
ncbi:MAG: shikimate dehydrogenase [Parvularculales bacterium]